MRLEDNIALKSACEVEGKVLPVYIIDPDHKDWVHSSANRLRFRLGCLKELRENIRDNGGELLVRQGNQTEVFSNLVENIKPEAVYWNRAYEPYEIKRDRSVRDLLKKRGVEVKTFKDLVFFEKEEILTKQDTPYKVFTPYSRRWKARQKPAVSEKAVSFGKSSLRAGELPGVQTLGFEPCLDEQNIWPSGRKAAIKRWADFKDNGLENYDETRDFPVLDNSTSQLSPYIRAGVISVRELYYQARKMLDDFGRARGVETFIEELIWRDFYFQVLANNPRVVCANFKEKYDVVEWEDHPDWLEAWKKGQTGYPLIDAAMRQLNSTGWMHNRLRMIVAMFLTKNCLIHWREGEKYFMNHLLDGDTAANNGGWQWSASTGTDAAPYFRIFNPVSQSEKYDSEGNFIRRYCPELSKLSNKNIHAPFECSEEELRAAGLKLGQDYPQPILDHKARRHHAIDVFKRVNN